MLSLRDRAIVAVVGLLALGPVASARALVIGNEPNNSLVKATSLTVGVFNVVDNLSANSGRPDTLIASYSPAFAQKLLTNDNSSPVGNGYASQLASVPFNGNGSAYFRVTGAPDTNFSGAHSQEGLYSLQLNFYNSLHEKFDTVSYPIEGVEGGSFDNFFIDPSNDPRRVGGSVTATVNNVVGAGTGDSLDFFLFSGLTANQSYHIDITPFVGFHPRIGIFDSTNHLLATDLSTLSGVADSQGKARIAVTGAADALFKGAHIEVGQYQLLLTPDVNVPEPGTATLMGLGLALAGLAIRRRLSAR